MKITKLGHSCFVAEPKEGVRILTDPGAFTVMLDKAENISAILITHEHQDHLHIESLRKVLSNNPKASVITNTAVGKFLEEANIPYIKLENGQSLDMKGVKITGFGNTHAEICDGLGPFQNTGYVIDSLCVTGDALESPNTKVDILAMPVTGPWMRVKDSIDYAKSLKPRVVFPVHDAHIQDWASFIWRVPENALKEVGIEFKKLELGKEEDL